MISICTTIYRETENLEVFVRSLVANASQKDFEIIIVDDENSCTKKLTELQKEFPQIKIVPHSKEDRIKYIETMIDFYKKSKVFLKKQIEGMEERLEEYKKTDMELWLPMPHNYNLAAKYASGDLLIFMPADYLIFFDIFKLKEGHFEWIDITSTEPYPDFSILPGLTPEEIRAFTTAVLEQAFKNGVTIVERQHGSRVVSRARYDEVGGFDERWFIRAFGEDLFNRIATGSARMSEKVAYLTYPYIGAIRSKNPSKHNYLSPDYDSIPEKHLPFYLKAKEYCNAP